MGNRIELFKTKREKIGWIEINDNGKISSNVSTSFESIAIALEKLIKDAISNGLYIRQPKVYGNNILMIQKKITSKEKSFIGALKDKINQTKFDKERVFAISVPNSDNNLVEGGAK